MQLLYRCYPPVPGIDPAPIFEPFINHPGYITDYDHLQSLFAESCNVISMNSNINKLGEECYLNDGPTIPSAWCREKVHMYAVGAEVHIQ